MKEMLRSICVVKSITGKCWLAFIFLFLSPLLFAQLANLNDLPRSSDSSIGLTIMGTIVKAGSGTGGVALVKENNQGSVKAVKAGGTLLGKSYSVLEVHAKYMILAKSDQSRILVYQDKFAGEFRGNKVVDEKMVSKPSNLGTGESFKEEGFERHNNQIKMSASYRDRLVNQELAKILMQATAEPAIENGVVAGFRFSQIDRDSIYAKSGLQDNDIVTGINGQKLTNVGEAVTLLKSLKQVDRLQIDLKRAGSTQSIQINVD